MNGREYGTLVNYDKDDAHAWNIVGWPKAHLILEAQAKLISFLRKSVEGLLKGFEDRRGSSKWNAFVNPSPKSSSGKELWSDYGRQAFSRPPVFDLVGLHEMSRCRLAAAEDEIELLQTNPGYVALQVNPMLKLEFYKAFDKALGDPWYRIAMELVMTTVDRCRIWRWITQELSYACTIHCINASMVSSRKPLLKGYAEFMRSLQRLLVNLQSRLEVKLRDISPTVLSLQHMYEFVKNPKGGLNVKGGALIKDVRKESAFHAQFKEEPLSWALYQLTSDVPQRDVIVNIKSFYFNFIDEHLSKNSASHKAQLDQRLYDHLADMAGINTILSAVRYSRAYAIILDTKDDERTQMRRGEDLATWRNYLREPAPVMSYQFKPVALALKESAQHGWPKGKRDQAWLNKAAASREKLEALWTAARHVLSTSMTKSTRAQEEIDYEVELTKFASKPRHVAEVGKERREILDSLQTEPNPRSLQQGSDWRCEDTASRKSEILRNATLLVQKKREKKRTAGAGRLDEDMKKFAVSRQSEAEMESKALEREVVVPVDIGALRIFHKTFSAVSSEEGRVRWQQFVAAMGDAVCSAINNGGSAVTFKHNDFGSIVFHRPHPEQTIDPVVLHVMGKRLTKRFGWDRETFAERQKVAFTST